MKKISLVLIIAIFLQSCIVRPRSAAHHYHSKVVYVKEPKHHRVVLVKGNKYHYWNGKYHKKN